MKKKIKKTGFCLVAVFIIILWVIWGNVTVGLTVINIDDDKLPDEFKGFKIVQISDLHNAEFGTDNSVIKNIVKKCGPDIVAVTGDIIDATSSDAENALDLMKYMTENYPVYYVTGNHEAAYPDCEELLDELKRMDVNVLEDDYMTLVRNGESINIIGVQDPDFMIRDSNFETVAKMTNTKIGDILAETEEGYTVLLSHRPELFEVYVQQGINLVFAGHAHGGQFRIPFIGGVISPDQGLFPEYDSGSYTLGETTMIVSRGLGNSIIPVRVNNRPEVVCVTLN
ncbi:MAG: metallophosphoesterase [Eubacterium sp.]|nr:metallophosphoesterase [Eubacterium sp.]